MQHGLSLVSINIVSKENLGYVASTSAVNQVIAGELGRWTGGLLALYAGSFVVYSLARVSQMELLKEDTKPWNKEGKI